MKFLFGFILALLPLQAFAVWEVVPPLRSTYSVTSAQSNLGYSTPYAYPTDICMIGNAVGGTGSNTNNKLLTVYHVRISGYQTTGGIDAFYLVKRSTLSTGPNTPLTVISHDTFQPSSYADVQWFSSAPSLGTTIGTVRGADVLMQANTGTAANGIYDWDFGPSSGTQPITLHQNEMLAVNMGGQGLPAGLKMICEFTWQEQ